MNKYFHILAFACLLTLSCTKYPSTQSTSVTGMATHISCRNAEISGKANLPSPTTTDLSFGVLYSTSSGVLIGTATQIPAKSFDSDYNYTINTEVLESETTYYYRSYIIQDNEIAYGEIKSFKTLSVSSMIATVDATDINSKDAVLNADLDLTDCKYDGLEYGFEVTHDGGQPYILKTTNHSEKKFSVKDESLVRDTRYSFVAYVKLDDRTYKSEAKTFTTTSIQATVTTESSKVSFYSATISGKLTVTSVGTFTTSVELYHSGTATTIESLKSSGTKQTISLNSDGTFSVVANGLVVNAQNYYCVIAKVDDVEFASSVKNLTTKSFTQPQLIDIGLSIKWASFNIGASKPEEYGCYFAWGDIVGQTWDGSKLSGGGFPPYPPYELDANNNLKPEYDAAHVILGGAWRMPTKAEQQELIDNCTSTWTRNYNGTGVAGIIFTSNKKGYTDKSIFLPAAGRGGYYTLDFAGSVGGYWSSTFWCYDAAWGLYFGSDNVCTGGDSIGTNGRPVRPVLE